MKKLKFLTLIIWAFLFSNWVKAQNPYIGSGIGKTSAGYTSASFWGRDIFIIKKMGISISPYLRFTNQEYDIDKNIDKKIEHDEGVVGGIINFSEEKFPGFENLGLIFGIGRFKEIEHRYVFIPDDQGCAIGCSYFVNKKKPGLSAEVGMTWRFKFKKIEKFYFNLNYTANTYSLFLLSIGASVRIRHSN